MRDGSCTTTQSQQRQPVAGSSKLLSWRGVQQWSVGRRAPSLCKIFVSFKTKKQLAGKALIVINLATKSRSKQQQDEEQQQKKMCTSANPTPEAATATEHRQTEEIITAPNETETEKTGKRKEAEVRQQGVITRGRHSYHGRSVNDDAEPRRSSCGCSLIPRRNSDVGAGRGRLSYERVSTAVLKTEDLPPVVQLGAHDSAAPCDTTGAVSGRRSTSSVGSRYAKRALSLVINTKDDDCDGKGDKKSQHMQQLFAGNPFLTRVTAAPMSASHPATAAEARPSTGFLAGGRGAEVKDRLVFFL